MWEAGVPSRTLIAVSVAWACLIFPGPTAGALLCGQKEPGAKTVTLATYKVFPGETTELALGRGSTGSNDIHVQITECTLVPGTHVKGNIERFLRGSKPFPLGDLKVDGVVTDPGRIDISVDVTDRKGLDPGTYRGNLDLDNQEVFGHALTIPATITVAQSPWWLVLLSTFPIALVGGVLVAWLQSGGTGNAPKPWRAWLSPQTVAALALGGAAAVGVWWKQYLDSATWSFNEWPSLISLMTAALAGGAGAWLGGGAIGKAVKAQRAKTSRAKDQGDQ
jgi:hypothetical protein